MCPFAWVHVIPLSRTLVWGTHALRSGCSSTYVHIAPISRVSIGSGPLLVTSYLMERDILVDPPTEYTSPRADVEMFHSGHRSLQYDCLSVGSAIVSQ